MVGTPTGPTKEPSKANIEKAKEKVRAASGGGVVSSGIQPSTGQAAKGSYLASGGGTQRIIVESNTGQVTVVDNSKITPSEQEAIEQGKQKYLEQEKQKEIEKQSAILSKRIAEGEREAVQASRISALLALQERTGSKFQQLAEQRRQELLAKAGSEAYTAHVPQSFIGTKEGIGKIETQVSGEIKPKVKKNEFRNDIWSGLLDNDNISSSKKTQEKSKFEKLAEYPYGESQIKSISTVKEDKKLAGFEKRIEASSQLSKDIEKMREQGIKYKDITILPLSQGLKRVETFASLVTGGGGEPLEERGIVGGIGQGFVQALISAPYYEIQFITYAPEVISKTILNVEGVIRPETRKSTLEESKVAVNKARVSTLEFASSPGGIGFLLGAGLSAGISSISKPKNIIQYENIKFRTKTEGGIKVTEIGVKTKAGTQPKMFEYVSQSGKTHLKLGLVPSDYAGTGTIPVATSTSNIAVRTLGVNVFGKPYPIIALKTEKINAGIQDFDVQIEKNELQPINKQEGLTPEQEYDISFIKQDLDTGEITKKQYDSKVAKILKKSPEVTTTATVSKIETVIYGGKAKGTKREIILGGGKPKVQSQLGELKSAIPPPITGVGTEVIQKVFELKPEEKIRIGAAQELIKTLKGERGLTVQEALFTVKQFKNKETASRIIEKFATRYGGKFFGSATVQQLPEGFRLISGDIDIGFKSRTEKYLIKKFPKLQKKLIESGEQVTIGKDLKSLEIGGEKVLEVKAGKGTITGEIAPEGGLGFLIDDTTSVPFGKRSLTISGFKKARATKAGEQLKRKGIASTYFRPASTEAETPIEFQEAGVLPRAKRTKDLLGFIVQSRGIIELRKTGFEELTTPKTPSIRKRELETEQATKALERYIKTFSPEQQKRIVEMIDENAPERKIEFEAGPEKAKGRSGLEGIEPGDVVFSPAAILKSKIPFSTVIKETKKKEKEKSPITKSSPKTIVTSPLYKSPTIQTSLTPKSPSPKIETSPVSPIRTTSPSFSPSFSPTPIISPSPIIQSPPPSPSPSPSPYFSPSPSPSPSPYQPYSRISRILFPSTSPTKKKKKSIFQVQIRRQGKFKPLAQLFATKQQAEIAEKMQIEKTLAASGKVIEVSTGKTVRPSIIPKGFYESRKQSGVIIQKRGERLGRRTERIEIQSSRKRAENIRQIFGGRK